ncbi:tyrosine-type recombinase/integrase [Nocardioides sp. MAH-18]|uniref:Tyrosine-type recombinase/integrase n=1 Tax=Nocardioides agri TaxID=2682843 RepID=A0A6L6XNM0_9ACTN|nr:MULTISPECIES: tyrosine-type recombinase/integrase [unclassified Nocardioides]MBA2953835.1 hypothetical protein [Nocardioides sp. CGMCC 1.13656]MVQ48700.1 tyrosine-type recombinase/integrase [Nocardioides sp. MAH-18]
MGRPLTGRIRPVATGWSADLPEATGSTRRARATFPGRDHAEAWLKDALAARRAGRPILRKPEWLAARTAATAGDTTEAPTSGTPHESTGDGAGTVSFRAAAEALLHERFTLSRRAGPDREVEQRRQADHLARYFEQRDLTPGTLTRAGYLDILCQWAGTIRGPLNRRQDPAAGGQLIGYAADVLRDHRRLLDDVLGYAWHVLDQPQLLRPDTVPTPTTQRPRKTPKRALTLAETAALAAELHAVHQFVVWLLRTTGLRISEGFGLHVGDVHPVPDGSGRGLLVVARQGGRMFLDRDVDGTITKKHEVGRTKTDQSVRLVPIPVALMALIQLVIEVFHTGPDGAVDPDARLIPDLTGAGSGQGSFGRGFATAAERAGLDVSSDLVDGCELPIPHDLRKAVGTEMAVADLPAWVRMRHLGHLAGTDVHHRHYLLDDPAAAPLLQVADALQGAIDAELPPSVAARLVVPTAVRCTTGNQPALAARADQIDAQLLEAGWLITPADAGTDLLDAEQVAAYLGLSVITARRYLRDGTLPSRPLPGGRADQRCAALADVEALRAALSAGTTMAELAEELGYGVSNLHQAAHRLGLPLERRGNITLVPEQTRAGLTAWVSRRRRLEADGYTHDQAAARLGVPVQTVRRLVTTGLLTALPTGTGERAYVTRSSVDRADLTAARGRRKRRTTARCNAA